ncbi:MAG: hypothetical protein RLZ98_1476 [Pseudomonadota bacterium]|jgi:hypothetical protein
MNNVCYEDWIESLKDERHKVLQRLNEIDEEMAALNLVTNLLDTGTNRAAEYARTIVDNILASKQANHH